MTMTMNLQTMDNDELLKLQWTKHNRLLRLINSEIPEAPNSYAKDRLLREATDLRHDLNQISAEHQARSCIVVRRLPNPPVIPR